LGPFRPGVGLPEPHKPPYVIDLSPNGALAQGRFFYRVMSENSEIGSMGGCVKKTCERHLHEELEMRLAEAERVGYGLTIPKTLAPSAPKISTSESLQIAA
jgi:hypothetical protein